MENQNQQRSAEQPAQQSSAQQQVVPSGKPNQSKLFLIIIFILLVTIPIGIYLFSIKNINQQKQTIIVPTISQNSPTPSTDLNREPNDSAATANWKMYTSTYGYSFQYPSQYFLSNQVADNEAQNNSPLVFIYPNKPSISNSYKVYFIVITKNLPGGYYDAKDLDPFTYNINKILLAKVGDQVMYANGETIRQPDEQINGVIFRTFDVSGERRHVFNSTKYIYIIGIHNNSSEERNILSTFKFTN